MKLEKNMKVKFPKDFVLVKEDVLNNFYNLIYNSKLSEKYLYEVKFEKTIFL